MMLSSSNENVTQNKYKILLYFAIIQSRIAYNRIYSICVIDKSGQWCDIRFDYSTTNYI